MAHGWKIAALLAAGMFAVASLVAGAPWLEHTLPGGLPLGNALAAVGLCALAGAAVLLAGRRGMVRVAALGALALAVVWLPVSVAMAGNLTLVFSGGRGDAWIALSLATVVAVLCALAIASATALVRRARRAPARG
ncbi:hypothetical protein [Lysobacter panacisoli]|uniref:SPW repeat-containing protein n=1 Tax=Lysobacter panacisoli TaxID=1255263 RepID=A0ABP9LBW4_9GAMM|nr:hypothetical protein [Lysobacter panacisoli]